MAKVFLTFNQTHIEVYVNEDNFADWEEIGSNPHSDEYEKAESEMIEAAKEIAEADGHDLTNLVDAVVGDF